MKVILLILALTFLSGCSYKRIRYKEAEAVFWSVGRKTELKTLTVEGPDGSRVDITGYTQEEKAEGIAEAVARGVVAGLKP